MSEPELSVVPAPKAEEALPSHVEELERLKLENFALRAEKLETLVKDFLAEKTAYENKLALKYSIITGSVDFATGQITRT